MLGKLAPVALGILALAQTALACPDADGVIDWNCDGRVEISMFGDSITRGVGDNRKIGYPGRIKLLAPDVIVNNLGNPGEETAQGKRRAALEFKKHHTADIAIILEGVNDYFGLRMVPNTKTNLLNIRDSARRNGALTFLSTLTPTARSYQRGWVGGVNAAIKPYTSLDYFSLSTGILGSDGLHPNAHGYDAIAKYALARLRALSIENRPADRDRDGMYDFAEARYGANPRNPDTDGDGILDGDEVFTYHSKPNSTDSDGDGLSDNYEVFTLHSDPASALPGAPTIQSLDAISG